MLLRLRDPRRRRCRDHGHLRPDAANSECPRFWQGIPDDAPLHNDVFDHPSRPNVDRQSRASGNDSNRDARARRSGRRRDRQFRPFQRFSTARSNDSAPPKGAVEGSWELVTTARSSNNGFRSKQFCAATVCDTKSWPEHASVVHAVEIRRRTVLWKELIIWRVSLLNGGQTSMKELHLVGGFDVPFSREYNGGSVRCFQSDGVIFIACKELFPNNNLILMVYDTRCDKKAAYYDVFGQDTLPVGKIVSVKCLERLHNSNRQLEGWRIRIIDTELVDAEVDDVAVYHARISTTTMNLKRKAGSINWHIIMIRDFLDRPTLMGIRTSDGLFGVHVKNDDLDDGPAYLYDQANKVFVFCQNREELLQLDDAFRSYVDKADDLDDDTPLVEDEDWCPTVLNRRECIQGFKNGAIYRASLAPPSLKYAAMKSAFEANPELRERMTADDFRKMTGMGGMEAHFGCIV